MLSKSQSPNSKAPAKPAAHSNAVGRNSQAAPQFKSRLTGASGGGKLRQSTATNFNSMSQMRQSIAMNQANKQKSRDSIKDTIARASSKFQGGGNSGRGENSGELAIENDRLKNTIALLNQKLKVQGEEERNADRLKKQIKGPVEKHRPSLHAPFV